MMFQSTRPRGSDDADGNGLRSPFSGFQSTRPRGERPRTARTGGTPSPVSIHAPARGATLAFPSRTSRACRFQSTRPRGERRRGVEIEPTLHDGFQSTRPRGERPAEDRNAEGGLSVSIHAPARGATSSLNTDRRTSASFNPRARAGSDTAIAQATRSRHRFQSTRPRGERPGSYWPMRRARSGFNPRARAGSDLQEAIPRDRAREFQSTRPRGERRARRRLARGVISVSIHAPARGATLHRDFERRYQ